MRVHLDAPSRRHHPGQPDLPLLHRISCRRTWRGQTIPSAAHDALRATLRDLLCSHAQPALVCEELGRGCSSTALCFGMHAVGSAVIAAQATPDQKRRYLEPIARGEHLTTLALSEPGTGAHFYLPQAKLTKQSADLYVVNGTKTFVTSGGHADSYVISTGAAHADAPPGEFSCFVMPRQAPGLHWEGWGMRGNSATTDILRTWTGRAILGLPLLVG